MMRRGRNKNIKKEDNKRKKGKRDSLDYNQKEQFRNYEKGVKKVIRVNLDDEKKKKYKKEENK